MSSSPGPDPEPPELPGYHFIRHIGSGGNARVYLYEQDLPRRKVAVKVLNDPALSEAARRRFTAEANVTAVLAHRHIVQVFEAKVTDDGRPYIVMPFYPQPNLSVRAKRARLPVAEVLRIGIQIGSAVETSHRNGVLHRDIKPQNILTDSYGEPALADFGIATTTHGDGPEGLSVPWSPPEILCGTGPGDQRSDVYSLGATLWHLLVGRPPFEQQGGGSNTAQLMQRINAEPPPRTQRADVPDSLERLLRQTMAKDLAARPQSAMELIRGLQSIEQELRLPLTQPILPVDEPDEGDTSGDTVVRPAAHGGEVAPPAADHPREPAAVPATGLSAGQLAEPALARPPERAGPPDATALRGGRPAVTSQPATGLAIPRRGRILAFAGVGLLAVVAAVAVVLTLPHRSGGLPPASAGTGHAKAPATAAFAATAAPTTAAPTTAAPGTAAATTSASKTAAAITSASKTAAPTRAAPATAPAVHTSVTVSHGQASDCVAYPGGCEHLAVAVTGFRAGTTLSYSTTGGSGTQAPTTTAYTGSTTTNGSGDATFDTELAYWDNGSTITVTVAGGGGTAAASIYLPPPANAYVQKTGTNLKVTGFPADVALTYTCSQPPNTVGPFAGPATNASGAATFTAACNGQTITVSGGGKEATSSIG